MRLSLPLSLASLLGAGLTLGAPAETAPGYLSPEMAQRLLDYLTEGSASTEVASRGLSESTTHSLQKRDKIQASTSCRDATSQDFGGSQYLL